MTYGEFYEDLNMTMSDESNITLSEWWNLTTLWETIDDEGSEFFDDPNMTSYGENLGVQDYEIVDFYDRNTTVSDFS